MVALMWTINDFPTYKIVSSLSTYEKLTFSYYIKNNKTFTLTNNDKTSFFLLSLDILFNRS